MERRDKQHVARLLAIPLAGIALYAIYGCSQQSIEASPTYQSACQGPPLRTGELRNQALEDGYDINREFDCIDKASFAKIKAERLAWEAANTPEAIARRKAEHALRVLEERERRAAAISDQARNVAPITPAVPAIDVNTATETDLANTTGVGPAVAAQIVTERSKGRFNDWADLINRVVGLSSAQTAIYASVCGLNVNGQYLPGAPPDASMAAALKTQHQEL